MFEALTCTVDFKRFYAHCSCTLCLKPFKIVIERHLYTSHIEIVKWLTQVIKYLIHFFTFAFFGEI